MDKPYRLLVTLSAIGLIAVATPLSAQPTASPGTGMGTGPGPGMGMGPGMGRGMGMGPGMARGPGFGRGMNDPVTYLAGLKGELAITPAQEPAWKEYASTVEDVAAQMRGMHTSAGESMRTATWQERQEMMNTMFAARDEAHRMVGEAAQKLLPSLTPEQRSLAATRLPGLIPTGPGPMMGAPKP